MTESIGAQIEREAVASLRREAERGPRYEVLGERGEPLVVRQRGQREAFMLEVRAMPLGADD